MPQKVWSPQPGPQTAIMRCASHQPGCCFAQELMFGGQRGGGKSKGAILWLLSGNLDLPREPPGL